MYIIDICMRANLYKWIFWLIRDDMKSVHKIGLLKKCRHIAYCIESHMALLMDDKIVVLVLKEIMHLAQLVSNSAHARHVASSRQRILQMNLNCFLLDSVFGCIASLLATFSPILYSHNDSLTLALLLYYQYA